MYNPYQPYYQQSLQSTQSLQQPQQIQSGGFISVRSEIEARNYPVAPGNSVTFIDENAPYCYTKTMGFSQFDRPRFEKFKLVKEETQEQVNEQAPSVQYALKTDLDDLKGDITAFKVEIEAIYDKINKMSGEIKDGE